MEVPRLQSDVQPELAYPAEPARSGVMSWKAPLAAIAGGTTSSVSSRRAAAASESILRPISLSPDFRRDCPSFSRRQEDSVASFSSHGNSTHENSHETGSSVASVFNTPPKYLPPPEFDLANMWTPPVRVFTGRICTQRL